MIKSDQNTFIGVYVKSGIKNLLADKALEQKISVSDLLRNILKEYFERHGWTVTPVAVQKESLPFEEAHGASNSSV